LPLEFVDDSVFILVFEFRKLAHDARGSALFVRRIECHDCFHRSEVRAFELVGFEHIHLGDSVHFGDEGLDDIEFRVYPGFVVVGFVP
jgi:hypothetical protein